MPEGSSLGESVKNISPMQWALIAGAGIGLGILWKLHNKSVSGTTTTTSTDTTGILSAADEAALQSLVNSGAYSGTSPTASAPASGSETGNVSFTPGGSPNPVQITGYTSGEVQDIISKLIPTPVASAPVSAPSPVNVPSPAPTPAPSPVAAAVQSVMDQGQYQATTANAPALIDWIQKGNVIAGSGPGGLSSRTQIAADIQNRINNGNISAASGQQILAALPAYKGPA